MKSYCSYARSLPIENIHREHHDSEHGSFPINDDDIFRRLVLEISQAGLSFEIVLKKKKAIYESFNSIEKVSKFKESDIKRLMLNPGIIRNRRKIESVIYNAQGIKKIQKTQTFHQWLINNRQETLDNWVDLFKKEFKFMGREIANEFLMSINMIPGAHDADCHLFKSS